MRLCKFFFSASTTAVVIAGLSSGFVRADSFAGKVISISDGDTITVLDRTNLGHKIRLSGIDAPEKGQPFGDSSKSSLAALVFGQEVTVEFEKSDKYGRIVGKVLVSGKDANLEQIKAGLAWHYKAYEKEQTAVDRHTYADAEKRARLEHRGLWRLVSPQPPWEYRKLQRQATGGPPPSSSLKQVQRSLNSTP